jgi:DNA-binding NarL/FixJ family response regulator
MEPLKIIVADDVPAFRYLVRKVFEPFSVFEVVGEAADGHSALEMTLRLLPHVCIMDVEMPRLSGMEATRRIKRVLPDVHVVGLSSHDDPLTRGAMTKAGCSAFITKDCAHTLPDVIAKLTGRQIITKVLEGGV